MPREFNRNMLIMLSAIMIGAIIITYFIGDIVRRTEIEDLTREHEIETEQLITENENLFSNFVISNTILDNAKEDQYLGDYQFKLAKEWYQTTLSEKNESSFNIYKYKTANSCTNAMTTYTTSKNNYNLSKEHFNETKTYTENPNYLELLELYIDLCDSGYLLTLHKHNASSYLKIISENLIFNANGTISYEENITDILALYNDSLASINEELIKYNDIKKEIDEYDLFKTIR